MTLASALVQQAFRESNTVELGTTITPAEQTEGLTLLNSFLESIFGFELGEMNLDWTTPPSETSPVKARWPLLPQDEELRADVWPYPPSNVRILMNFTADTTLFLNKSPDDGARMLLVNIGTAGDFTLTLDGNGRLVGGNATLVGLQSVLAQRSLFYRADQGNWTTFTSLALTDESPLPVMYDDFLSIGVAKRLAPRNGRSIAPELEQTYRRLRKRLKTQYQQSVGIPSAKPQPFTRPTWDPSRAFFSDGGLGS